MPTTNKLILQHTNYRWRHVKPSQSNPRGGRIQKEAPIHLSNVMPLDPRADRGVRVRFELKRGDSGQIVGKQRVCVGRRGSGAVLGAVATKKPKGGSA